MTREVKMNKRIKLKAPLLRATSLLILGAYSATTFAATVDALEGQASTQSATQKTSLQLKFEKPLTKEPSITHNEQTNQITVLLTGVDKKFQAPQVSSTDPLISNVSVNQQGSNVELILNTKKPARYVYVSQGLGGTIVLEEASSFQTLNNSIAKINAPQMRETAGPTEISKVNFKKEGIKNGKLTVNLTNSNFTPVVKKEDDKLVVEFKGVAVPTELQRRVSTENVGTVTENIDITNSKVGSKIVLEQKEGWDYSFYQLGSQFVVEVKSSDKVASVKRYTGKPITISFQDMDVRAILQVIADFTGLNVISSDKVTGTMTIRLKEVPWDQALDLILEARGLQKIQDGNVIWVATGEEVTANNENKLKLQSQNEALEPLKLEFFQINYYKADDLKTILEGDKNGAMGGGANGQQAVRILSKRGTIGVDARNNMLFVQDTEDKLKEVRRIIKKLDIANKQVLVEAKIVIAKDSWGRELGTKFGAAYRGANASNAVGINNNWKNSYDLAAAKQDTIYNPMTDFAAKAINGVNPGTIGITLLNFANGVLSVELSALEQTQQGKVLSSPRVLTADNKKAVIEQGTQVPYVTPGSANSPATVTFQKATLKLEVTPQISPNGKVSMQLDIHKDSIGQLVNVQGGGQIPSIDTKSINTLVTVNNGQTVVLGGVYEIADENDVNKIPLLGDIPVLGWLFKDSSKGKIKGELMIFITPYIVDDETLDDGTPTQKLPEVSVAKQ